ncbi:MAG: DUF5615 family PIN-like protein [Rhodopirellula sp.]|nr:DUF5615 family PIN-like protein [Rhodopirellula sp.]
MSAAVYMDHHVPVAITRGLRQQAVEVLAAEEDQGAEWEDDRLLERATNLGRIVFTQDEDFLGIAHQWQNSRRDFAGIVSHASQRKQQTHRNKNSSRSHGRKLSTS